MRCNILGVELLIHNTKYQTFFKNKGRNNKLTITRVYNVICSKYNVTRVRQSCINFKHISLLFLKQFRNNFIYELITKTEHNLRETTPVSATNYIYF